MVEESIVILRPIAQFGCFKASSTRIFRRSSCFFPRNGPPDAVSRIFFSSFFPWLPCRDWKMALCSLSTGRIFTPHSFASGIMICPAVTSVSLFARAISFPALIAAIVGRMPIIPTIAVTRISLSSIVAISRSPSIPETTFTSRSRIRLFSSFAFSSVHIATSFGWNSRICFSRRSTFVPAASPVTSISLFSRITSSVWVPIEPVEPNIAIFFI